MHDRVKNSRYVDAKLRSDPMHGPVPPALSHICRRGLVARELRDTAALNEALQAWVEGRSPVVCPRTAIQRVLCGWSRFLNRYRIAGPALSFLVVAVLVACVAFTVVSLFH
jgi:hypothetical protein